MEIKGLQLNGTRVQPGSVPDQKTVAKKGENVSNSGKIKQDTLTVNGSGRDLSDSQFINMVKKHLLTEVSRETPEYKLNDLRDQISMGKYEVNVNEIARKMMMESEI